MICKIEIKMDFRVVGANAGLSDDEESEQSEEEEKVEDRFAHETPDETRLRYAERYVRKLEALSAAASRGGDDDEEDEEDGRMRVAKRLKQDVLEATGRYRRRLAGEVRA